ncbi:MAG: MFS-type transporter involved in bile tolerance (Atg22 family) [Mariniflexile sp.]
MESNKNKKPGKQLNNYALFSGIVIQMFAIIGIGTFLGVKLDEKFPNKNNLYTIIVSLTSVVFAIVFVIRRIIAASKDTK